MKSSFPGGKAIANNLIYMLSIDPLEKQSMHLQDCISNDSDFYP